jgi:hypothetical protein
VQVVTLVVLVEVLRVIQTALFVAEVLQIKHQQVQLLELYLLVL